MKNKAARIISLALIVILTMTCLTCIAQAADAKAVLTFKVSDDGYAIVSDCQESAKGVVSVPTSVEIKNKTYKIKYIGDKAFDKCKSITEIYIPEGVTAIGSYAFRNCSKLTDVYIPESLIRCEFDAFDGCNGLTVHCYMSTYQFINICASNPGISFDIIDPPEENGEGEVESDGLDELGFIGKFIKAIKTLIESLLDRFNANDDDFSIEDLPFDLPFDIPEENDNPFIDLL